ncbi:MAG: pyruvate kinase, partial [Adhaeribacter sp.]|nr:pyruvate kinase [Adhaeribacter sp.]
HDEVFHKIVKPKPNVDSFFSKTVISNACALARDTEATAVVCMTRSGFTALHTAKNRPKAHIFVFTDNLRLVNQLNMVWGVRTYFYDKEVTSTDNLIADFRQILTQDGHLMDGNVVVNISSMPATDRTSANTIKLSRK